MVKLIRIASDDNGIFRSNFQNDIIVEPQSKMALLNATFKVDFESLNITPQNNQITVETQSGSGIPGGLGDLEITSYTNSQEQQDKLLKNILATLNSCLDGQGFADFPNNNGSQFNIRQIGEKKRIEFRYTPFVNPLFLPGKEDTDGDSIFNIDSSITNVFINSGNGTYLTTISKQPGQQNTEGTDNNIITGSAKLCSGNGLMVITMTSTDLGSGLQNNGFGFGLTNSKLTDFMEAGETIPEAKRGFEMRFNRATETYKIRKPGETTETDTGVLPLLVFGGNNFDHDFFYYERNAGFLEGGVCQVVATSHLNLVSGSPWIQSGTGTQENFDTTNLGDIATYRRTQVGSTVEQWWETTSSTGWNIYFNGPPTSTDTADALATADLTTGVITITGLGVDFTPSGGLPPTVIVKTPTKTPFFQEVLNDDELDLYPYIYLNGGPGFMTLTGFNMTIDPWVNQDYNSNPNDDSPYWGITGLDEAGNIHNAFTNGFDNTYRNNWINAKDENKLNIPDENDRWVGTPRTFAIKMHKDVWNFLGFTNLPNLSSAKYSEFKGDIGINKQQNCWSFFTASDDFSNSLSDSFLLESRTLQLDSFDASQVSYTDTDADSYINPQSDKQGRRKNILMTIPVNDNVTGLVEYDSNTPIYIDINNANRLNQKTLNFQILDKNFNQIKTSDESSILTILIKGPNE